MEAYEVTVEQYDEKKHTREWFWESDAVARGICNIETWRDKDGLIHREGGPALIMRDVEDGKVLAEGWYSHGVLHRDGDMPAIIQNKEHNYLLREWHKSGQLHRDCGPAIIATVGANSSQSLTISENWFKDGKEHRIGGPALSQISEYTGVVIFEAWLQTGLLHRLDGPAEISRNEETGIADEEIWYRHGQCYRAGGGPHLINRNPQTGEIVKTQSLQTTSPPQPSP